MPICVAKARELQQETNLSIEISFFLTAVLTLIPIFHKAPFCDQSHARVANNLTLPPQSQGEDSEQTQSRMKRRFLLFVIS
jgi:hypothetical protein